MCIAAIAVSQNSFFPLIIVHNRDEFKNRPFSPLKKRSSLILGGVDLKDPQSEGMWFGINENGGVGFITSFRDRSRWNPEAPSRGYLVREYLRNSQPAVDFLSKLENAEQSLNPLNLVLGNVHQLYYWNSDQKKVFEIGKGIHVLSNAYLNTSWPKTDRLRNRFTQILTDQTAYDFEIMESKLFPLMEDKTLASPQDLPRTGLSSDMELALSSVFVDTPVYGTLLTTIFMVNSQGVMRMTEFQHHPDRIATRRFYEIRL